MKTFLAFLRKEFYHILRDVRTVMILLTMPLVLIILFGFALTNEIADTPFAVCNPSSGEMGRQLIDELKASEYFSLKYQVQTPQEVEGLFQQGKIKLALILPSDFEAQYHSHHTLSVQILADASDPNEATNLTTYLQQMIQKFQHQQLSAPPTLPLIVPEVKLLYNPLMKSSYNFVPGVMGLVLILICSMMTSIGIVREKEMGTLEVLLVSPLRPSYIIIAKVIPYFLLSFVNVITILLLSYFVLGVPIHGSLFAVFLLSTIYSLVSLSLGILISNLVSSQQAAMLISAVGLMLPVMLLSGMIFPLENMPQPLQWLSYVVPARYYIEALKDCMIKGLSLADILPEIGVLLGMLLLLIAASVKRFKTHLD